MKSKDNIFGFSFYWIEKVYITFPFSNDLFRLQTRPIVPLCNIVKSETSPFRFMISSGWVILLQTASAKLKIVFLFNELKNGT